MASSLNRIYVHVVFSTKKRLPLILPEHEKRLWRYFNGIGKKQGFPILVAGGMADHIHLLIKMPATVSTSKMVQTLKANSSLWMNNTFFPSRSFGWQAGYGAFSVSQSQVQRVQEYISNQKARHREISFKEEFIQLLNAHDIEFDEDYVFE